MRYSLVNIMYADNGYYINFLFNSYICFTSYLSSCVILEHGVESQGDPGVGQTEGDPTTRGAHPHSLTHSLLGKGVISVYLIQSGCLLV
jgi:hypothetical protein